LPQCLCSLWYVRLLPVAKACCWRPHQRQYLSLIS